MFDETFKCVGDYDMTIRLCLKKYKSVYVDQAFSTYRLGGFSLEATNDGTVFKEVSDIYYNNYNKLCPLTREEAEKICGDIFSGDYNDIPLKLANKLQKLDPYFDYNEYLRHTKLKNRLEKKNRSVLYDWYEKLKFAVFSPNKFLKKYATIFLEKEENSNY